MANDLTGQNLQDSYKRVLTVGDDGLMYDGTGSLYTPLSASHEITTELSSSHAVNADTASFATDFTASGDIKATNINASNGNISASGDGTSTGIIYASQYRVDDSVAIDTVGEGIAFGNTSAYNQFRGNPTLVGDVTASQHVRIQGGKLLAAHIEEGTENDVHGEQVGLPLVGNTVQIVGPDQVIGESVINSENARLIIDAGSDDKEWVVSIKGGSAGSIKATGNISASGNLTAANVYLPGQGIISFDNSLDGTDQFIKGQDDNITIEGDNYIKLRADNEVRFQDNSGDIFTTIDPNTGNIYTSGSITQITHITASGNIHSSGTGSFEHIRIQGGGLIQFDDSEDNDQFISGNDHNITIDGDNVLKLRADETIEFQDGSNNAQVTVNPIAGHITASGEISASSALHGSSITVKNSAYIGTHDGEDYLYLERFSSTYPYSHIFAGKDDNNIKVGMKLVIRNNLGAAYDGLILDGVEGEATFANVVNCTKVNTGQGDNELHAMDQDVQTSDSPIFAEVSSSGRVYSKNPTFIKIHGAWIKSTDANDWWGPPYQGPNNHTWSQTYGTGPGGNRSRLYGRRGFQIPVDSVYTGFKVSTMLKAGSADQEVTASMWIVESFLANDAVTNGSLVQFDSESTRADDGGTNYDIVQIDKLDTTEIFVPSGSMIYPRVKCTTTTQQVLDWHIQYYPVKQL